MHHVITLICHLAKCIDLHGFGRYFFGKRLDITSTFSSETFAIPCHKV